MAFTFEYKAQVAQSTSNPITVNSFTGTYSNLVVLHIATTGGERNDGTPGLTPSGATFSRSCPNVVTAEGSVEIWHLLNDDVPKTLGISINIPNSSNLDIISSVSIFNTASQSWASLYATASATASSTSPNVTIGINANGVAVDSMFTGYASLSNFTYSRTLLYLNGTESEIRACQYYINDNTSESDININMGYTTNASDNWAISAASFNEIDIPVVTGTISTVNGVFYQPNAENYISTINGVYTANIGTINGVQP